MLQRDVFGYFLSYKKMFRIIVLVGVDKLDVSVMDSAKRIC